MGVYIKGMEMPKYGCDHCFLRTGNYCGRIEKDEAVVEYARKNERHPNCPLVPVPPHGRLGDLDLLTKVLKAKAANPLNQETTPYSWAFSYECLADVVGDMPTIIPAEGGE